MNPKLQEYARQEILYNLNKVPLKAIESFRGTYCSSTLDLSVEAVTEQIPADILDEALTSSQMLVEEEEDNQSLIEVE